THCASGSTPNDRNVRLSAMSGSDGNVRKFGYRNEVLGGWPANDTFSEWPSPPTSDVKLPVLPVSTRNSLAGSDPTNGLDWKSMPLGEINADALTPKLPSDDVNWAE